MKFLEIMIEILSPAIITERRSLRGYLKPLDFIPASMLRGAILSRLYGIGAVNEDFLKNEKDKPSIISSYAHPLIDGKKTYPGHPFMYKCKICDEKIENRLSEVLEELEKNGELKEPMRVICEKGHAALESLYSKPCTDDEDSKALASRFICTSVNKRLGSSEAGMIYYYEAIAPGAKFWATIALPDEVEEHVDGLEIYIGRGISRGFGRSKIVKVKEIDLKDFAMRIEEVSVREKHVVLYAQSPLVNCCDDFYTPYPPEIDLSRISARFGIDEKGKLTIKAVYGRAGFRIGGWDMRENVEKPFIKFATKPGAIAVAEFVGSPLALAALSLLGTTEYLKNSPITGVNMLHPIRAHPILTLGG